MKKHLALVLALVMVLSSFSFVSAAPDFADMDGHPSEEAVARLELLGVLAGYPDGTFKPDNSISRAEFAAVAVRARGLEGVATAAAGLPSGFSDVPAWHWSAGYVGTAASMGIVNGIGNGLFAPDAPVKYEEAVTMLVRALGYENDAQTKGGYPYGYLIVAEEIDLLDDVRGTQGTWATRAMVAQMTDNALEIPMMISVGTGDDARWIVSGEDRTDEQYLLDFMGFDKVTGVVEVQDMADMEIELDGDDYVVPAGFDFFVLEGAEITAWVDGDDIVVYTVEDEILFGAVEANDDLDEIEMIKSEDEYDVAEDVDVKDADFAKVVINGDDEVSFFEGYDMDGFILVDVVDDELILDINEDEVDVEDFVVLMNGMTVGVEALEEGDVVFYVADDTVLGGEYEGLAVAYNDSVVGEIDRVYSDEFRLEGEEYAWTADALYLDEGDLDDLTVEMLEGMMDEEMEVEAFLDFNGDVVLVVGDTGEAKTDTFYATLTENTNVYSSRRGNMLAVDVITEFGEQASYDVEVADLENDTIDNNLVKDEDVLAGTLVEITVDEDGDVEGMFVLETEAIDEAFEIDDTYVEVDGVDYRLMSSTVVFYDYDGTEYDEVILLGDVDGEFSEVEVAEVYLSETDRVEVVLATATDSDTDTTDYTGLVTNVRRLSGGEYEFTIEVAGEEMEFDTESDALDRDAMDAEDQIVTLTVGDTSNEIESYVIEAGIVAEVEGKDVSDDEIMTDKGTFELTSDAVIYDADFDIIKIRDLEVEDVITVYLDADSARFVNYVLLGAVETPADEDEMTGLITYRQVTQGFIIVDTKTTYFFDETTVVTDADDVVIGVGLDGITETAVGDQVEVTAVDGVADVVKIVKTAQEIQDAKDAAAAKVVEDMYLALPDAEDVVYADKEDIEAAAAAYTALTPAQQALVSDEAIDHYIAAQIVMNEFVAMKVTGVGATFDGTDYYAELFLEGSDVADTESISLSLYLGTTEQATITATANVWEDFSDQSTIGGTFVDGDEYWVFDGEIGTGTNAPNMVVVEVVFSSGLVETVSSTVINEI